jgi:hypothetical protein
MKREVIERAQEARLRAEAEERRAFEDEDTLEMEPPFEPVESFEAVETVPVPPQPFFQFDSDWMWTLVALGVWAIFVAGIGLSPTIAVIGAVVIVFSWQKRRPWADEYSPRWRGWPGL